MEVNTELRYAVKEAKIMNLPEDVAIRFIINNAGDNHVITEKEAKEALYQEE